MRPRIARSENAEPGTTRAQTSLAAWFRPRASSHDPSRYVIPPFGSDFHDNSFSRFRHAIAYRPATTSDSISAIALLYRRSVHQAHPPAASPAPSRIGQQKPPSSPALGHVCVSCHAR